MTQKTAETITVYRSLPLRTDKQELKALFEDKDRIFSEENKYDIVDFLREHYELLDYIREREITIFLIRNTYLDYFMEKLPFMKDILWKSLRGVFVIVANGEKSRVSCDSVENSEIAAALCAQCPVLVLSRTFPEKISCSDCEWYWTLYAGSNLFDITPSVNRIMGYYNPASAKRPFSFTDFPVDIELAPNEREKIFKYKRAHFKTPITNFVQQVIVPDNSITKSKRTCRIIIKNDTSKHQTPDYANRIIEIIQLAKEILDNDKYKKLSHIILQHLENLLRHDFSLYLQAHEALAVFGITELDRLVAKAEKLARCRVDAMGIFAVDQNGECHIELYYNKIEDVYKNNNLFSDSGDFNALFEMVLVHELAHAFHYAAIMTAGGSWDRIDDNNLINTAVEETIAEWAALEYTIRSEYKNVEAFIRNEHEKSVFPNDGGYCGAVRLKTRDDFDSVLKASLWNMQLAYNIIEKNCIPEKTD